MAMDEWDKKEAVAQLRLALGIIWDRSRELLADNPELTPEVEFMTFREAHNDLDSCIDYLAERLGIE